VFIERTAPLDNTRQSNSQIASVDINYFIKRASSTFQNTQLLKVNPSVGHEVFPLFKISQESVF
jgi:hypothetical protein